MDSAWDEFNWATTAGVEKLQKHLGVDQTGKLSLGDVVFLPTAARVTDAAGRSGRTRERAGAAGEFDGADGECRAGSGPAIRGQGG